MRRSGTGLPYTLCTMSTTSIEQVAAAEPPQTFFFFFFSAGLWFQLYIQRDGGMTKELVARASDGRIPGARDHDRHPPPPGTGPGTERNGLTIPPELTVSDAGQHRAANPATGSGCSRHEAIDFANFTETAEGLTIARTGNMFNPAVGWDDIADAAGPRWEGPLILKGPVSHRRTRAGRSPHGSERLPAVQPRRPPARPDRCAPRGDLIAAVREAVGTGRVGAGGFRGSGTVRTSRWRWPWVRMPAQIGRAYLYGMMVGGEAGADKVHRPVGRASSPGRLNLLGVRSVAELRSTRVLAAGRGQPARDRLRRSTAGVHGERRW